MKVTRFVKRKRRTAERAVGSVVCKLSFPLLDEQFTLRPLAAPANAIENTRKFVLRHLEKRASLLENASFVVYAEMRARSGALQLKALCKWSHGDNVEESFKSASDKWRQLDFEEDYTAYETDIEIPDLE